MIHLPASVRVYLCLSPCDMRRSFDGLHALVRDHLQLDAFAGHLYLFANKRRDRLKLLYWDRSGFAIWAKRLEAGTLSRSLGFCWGTPEEQHGWKGIVMVFGSFVIGMIWLSKFIRARPSDAGPGDAVPHPRVAAALSSPTGPLYGTGSQCHRPRLARPKTNHRGSRRPTRRRGPTGQVAGDGPRLAAKGSGDADEEDRAGRRLETECASSVEAKSPGKPTSTRASTR
jgi:hypothetical protein